MEPSSLYRSYSCSKIARILVREKGGYICGNCHSVIHYDKYIPLLNKIFDNKSLIKKILDDYNRVTKKFTLMSSTNSIGDPLITSNKIYDSLERYLTAIYEISKSGCNVTTSALADYLKISVPPVHTFFRKWSDLIRQYVNIVIGRGRNQSIYILTDKGKELISLIYHFKNYYKSP